jgi:hypothetical protein
MARRRTRGGRPAGWIAPITTAVVATAFALADEVPRRIGERDRIGFRIQEPIQAGRIDAVNDGRRATADTAYTAITFQFGGNENEMWSLAVLTSMPQVGGVTSAVRGAKVSLPSSITDRLPAGLRRFFGGRSSSTLSPGAPVGTSEGMVSTLSGTTVRVPIGWEGRVANNGRGLVYQRPGASRDVDSIRIIDPGVDPRYPAGYVRYYGKNGQPLDRYGHPNLNDFTHVPVDYNGPIPPGPRS